MTTITKIMQLCGDMPNPAAHQHYLEQLPPRHLEQRLADLTASEEHHAERWCGGQRHDLRDTRELTNA